MPGQLGFRSWMRPFSLAPVFAIGLQTAVGAQALTVPFRLERNRVIIPTRVNGSEPLKLILDTGMGMDGVYLFHQRFTDGMDTTGAVEVRVGGAGAGEASAAIMLESGHLAFGDVALTGQHVIISRSAHTQGLPSDGVIGWSLFGHHTVEIDYDREVIRLHDTTYAPAEPRWAAVPVEMRNHLPFLTAGVALAGQRRVELEVYIDLAAADGLVLLLRPGQQFAMPEGLEEVYLGTGLSGDVHGYRGGTATLTVGGFTLDGVATVLAPAAVRSKQEGADGVLGNDAIRRFNVIFDYVHHRLWLRARDR